MSLSGISSSSLFSYENQNIQNQNQNKMQQFQQEFRQLGEDLQAGNLSAAQTDFATLQHMAPQGNSSSSGNNPIQQAFNQLSQDLASGNLSAAQQDYSNIQQDFQSQVQQSHGHRHHHGGGGGEMSQISQSFEQLGQALQSGNLSSAQQIYSTMTQEIQQFGGSTESTQGTAVNGVSVTA